MSSRRFRKDLQQRVEDVRVHLLHLVKQHHRVGLAPDRLLAARDENHTHLVSEESTAGPLLPLFFGSGKLAATLDKWLTAIKTAAEQAQP
jgi:hypothetical protein